LSVRGIQECESEKLYEAKAQWRGPSGVWWGNFTTVGNKNLLHMHDARVGADVVDRVGLLGLIDIILLKDIVESERLLGGDSSHIVRFTSVT
jgi:hypothetical protein